MPTYGPDAHLARKRAENRLVTALNNPREITGHDRGTLVKLESLALELATCIEQYTPEGRLKSLALTHLEETLTWANKAIYTLGANPGPAVVDDPTDDDVDMAPSAYPGDPA